MRVLKVCLFFLLAVYSKIEEESDELKEWLLNEQELGYAGFEDSQSLQLAHNAKIKKCFHIQCHIHGTRRKAGSKEEVESLTIHF